jgi:hypothetical protein
MICGTEPVSISRSFSLILGEVFKKEKSNDVNVSRPKGGMNLHG